LQNSRRKNSVVAAIFLSDAHLKNKEDPGYRNLLRLFDDLMHNKQGVPGNSADKKENRSSPSCIRDVQDLYILGDFFEFWFSRKDRIYPGFKPVIDSLVALQNKGIRVHLCEGNHDFFLEDYFSDILKMPISEEWLTFDLDGKRILVSHGDTVDRANKTYLFTRKILRSRAIRLLKDSLPLPMLWSIARKCAEFSKAMSREPKDRLVEKMHRFALDKFNEGFDAVILGHCHVPVLRETVVGERQKTFATLGDWIDHYSYLYYADGRFELCYLK